MNILDLMKQSVEREIRFTKQQINLSNYKGDLKLLKSRLSKLNSLIKALNTQW